MADTNGMSLVIRGDAKGLVAEMKNAQGVVVATSQIMKSQLEGATKGSANAMSQLKEGMGRARETAMFFTQSLQGFGPAGQMAQTAISGIGGAIIGGGGLLAALSLAKVGIELLADAWRAEAKAAEEASAKNLKAAREIAAAATASANAKTLEADKKLYTERFLLDRKFQEDLKAMNAKIAEERKATGDDVQSESVKALVAERTKLMEAYNQEKAALARLEAQAKSERAAAAGEKAAGQAKSPQQLADERQKATNQYMAGINQELKAEEEAASERGRTMLAEQEAQKNREAKQAAERLKTQKDFAEQMKPLTNSIQEAFAGVVDGSMSVGKALKKVLAGAVQAFLQMAIQQITANAAVAGSGAAASQAGIPIFGPGLAAAAMAAMMGLVMGLTSMISASGGADIGNYAPMAQLHPREMVLPAHIADPLRETLAGGGFGGGINLTINATDSKSVRRLFLDNGPALAEAIGKAARDGRRFG